MKHLKKFFALCLVLTLCMSMIPAAFAANSLNATIDTDRKANLDLYKYDFTSANADGILEWDSYVSTGTKNEAVESALSDYAIQGVVFTYVKIADITTYTAQEPDGYKDMVQYGFTRGAKTTQLLNTLGLAESNAYRTEGNTLYFVSDVLIDALADKLDENSSAVKNDLEKFIADQGGVDMPETDENGHSSASSLDLGLYLLVETYVPENVFNTTAPFFVSLPTTTIDGADWNYDLTIYPKNENDAPNLEKTLREAKDDTGKHNGTTDDIHDGYAHTGTGSDGDVVDYQIISTLPSITSNATALTTYTFVDTLSKGIEYNKNDVKLEWFKDAACTDLIATWKESDGKFTATYGTAADHATTMTIAMTESGLNEINNSTAVYDSSSLYRGYSDCTVRITYACTVNSDADVVYGDNGNPNEVVLIWKRTNTGYYDTLNDDTHVYTYGLDLTKHFSDELGNFANVRFMMHNDTDNYWVVAELDEASGIYYVTDHVAEEANATKFVPVSNDGQSGKVIVKGLEDDNYTITEVQTDDGYTLLKDAIEVVISVHEDGEICDICGQSSLTATATVNGDTIIMTEDNGSLSAIVPLTVIITKNFDLPQTGDNGIWMYGAIGILLMAGAIALIFFAARKKKSSTN